MNSNKIRKLTAAERKEYNRITKNSSQITIEQYLENQKRCQRLSTVDNLKGKI